MKEQYRQSYLLLLLFAAFFWQGCGPSGKNSSSTPSGEPPPKPVFVTSILQPGSAVQGYIDLKAANESDLARQIRKAFPDQDKQMENLNKELQGFLKATGMQIEDIAELAVMVSSLESLTGEDSDKELFSLPSGVTFAAALKVTGEVDLESILNFIEAQTEDEGGLDGVRDTKAEFEHATLMTIPMPDEQDENRTGLVAHKVFDGFTFFLIGDDALVRSALSSGKPGNLSPGSEMRSRLLAENVGWLSMDFPPGLLDKGEEDLEENEMLAGFSKLLGKISSVGLAGNITSTFPMQVRIGFVDAESSEQGAATLNGLLGLFKLMALKDPSAIPPFLNSLTVKSEDTDLVVDAIFTFADVEAFQNQAEKDPGLLE